MFFLVDQGERHAVFACSPDGDDVSMGGLVTCVCQVFLGLHLVSEGRDVKTMSLSHVSSELPPPALSSTDESCLSEPMLVGMLL